MKRAAISEGQITFSDTAKFSYYVKDHLGNVRAVFDTKGKILQKSDYYPFGLSISRDSLPLGARIAANRYLYNEKELQVGSGYLDYGARMYMPEVGRFNKVDRFSEKYVGLSPYSYAANNPIRLIDVNGDSLWISYKGENIIFNNGKLYNRDGSDYAGKVKGFLKQAFKSLNSINENANGNKLLEGLSGSENNFFVMDASKNEKNPGSNEFVEFDRNASYASAMKDANQGNPKDGGSGGIVYWNPNSGSVLEIGGSIGVRPISNLGHELFHAYDANLGLLDNRPSDIYLNRSEVRASYFENNIRKGLGYPFREYYNTIKNGPVRILDSNNIPINYNIKNN